MEPFFYRKHLRSNTKRAVLRCSLRDAHQRRGLRTGTGGQ